jgi:hypothetical protein
MEIGSGSLNFGNGKKECIPKRHSSERCSTHGSRGSGTGGGSIGHWNEPTEGELRVVLLERHVKALRE